jgi:hypothetical protein
MLSPAYDGNGVHFDLPTGATRPLAA